MSKSTIFAILLILFPCLFSCTGTVDDNTVPEGVLRIFVDGSTTIKADGADKVVFRVMYGAEDVSTSTSMNLIREYAGDDSRLDAGVNEFSTTTPGTYIFTARYYDGAAVYTDNSVTVTAVPAGDVEISGWSQKVLALQFTSTTCSGCPALSSAIKQLQSENPGLLYPVAFHMNYVGTPDPMTIPVSSSFANHLIGTSVTLPAFFYNLHQPHGQQMNNSLPVIRSELDTELESYVPSCGISVASEYDEASGTVTVTAGIKSNEQQVCRLAVFLVEDGIVYPQLDDIDYVHDNVVRAVLTNGVSGDPVNNRLPLYPGTECVVTKTAQVAEGWNTDNMRVVAAVLVQTEDGQSYRSDNVNACELDGGASDYQINE